jgi:hypothetical protein
MSADGPDIDRIVAAVADAPNDLDKDQLLSDLQGAVSLYRYGFALRHERADRREDMKKAIALAKRLKSIPYVRARHDLCVELDRLSTFTEADRRLWRFLGVRKKISAFDSLIGNMLRRTFEKHFPGKKIYTKDHYDDDNPIKGPFIDFAEKVLQEFEIRHSGQSYSRRAIADAYTKGKRAA